MDSEKVNRIKDAFYQVMDGLNALEDLLDVPEVSKDKDSAMKALKIMKGVDLERFWMRSK